MAQRQAVSGPWAPGAPAVPWAAVPSARACARSCAPRGMAQLAVPWSGTGGAWEDLEDLDDLEDLEGKLVLASRHG